LARVRHMFPGGNSCYGFYSFYEHMVPVSVRNKIVLKGGPGVGKSTFMKMIGEDLRSQQIDVEYHWCSSDNNSLDGVVGGNRQVCVLDGTAPHVVDPVFPGAVDRIINLGEFWNTAMIAANRESIIKLTNQISLCFKRAYIRLNEAQSALTEWQSYIHEASDTAAANRNVLALGDDFLQHCPQSFEAPRHLFGAAISPEGIVSHVDSLVEDDYTILAVKGSPGGGCKDLFRHIEHMLGLSGIYAEIYHCPFDPRNIDMIIIPENKSILLDISATLVDYEKILPTRKYKRFLDFDQFLDQSILDTSAQRISASRERFVTGVAEAIGYIKTAKNYHDELETHYIPAMDFEGIDALRKEVVQALLQDLG